MTPEQRQALRARFHVEPVIKSQPAEVLLTDTVTLPEEVDKDGTKTGAGGKPQPYGYAGRYVGRVGTRSPKSADPETAHMDLHQVLKEDPKWGDRTLDMVRGIPGFEIVRSHTEAVDKIAQYILDTADTVPADLEHMAKQWYPLGHNFDVQEANAAGLHPDVVHVVTARLSPQKDWFHNLAMSRAMVRRFAENPTIDKETVDLANKLRISAWETKANPNIPKPKPLKASDIVGKKLNDLDNDLAAELVRPLTVLMGENHTINIDGSPEISGGKLKGISWQSQASLAPAMRILRDPSPETAHEVLGSQHKIRSFYENLRDPHNESGYDDTTIDTHAFGLGVGIPMSSAHPIIHDLFQKPGSRKSGVTGAYPLFVEANRQARIASGGRFKHTSEIQAVTWEGQRALWPRTARKAWVIKAISKIRSQEAHGKISHEVAKDLVETLRIQLPGIAPAGEGVATPARIKNIPQWALES